MEVKKNRALVRNANLCYNKAIKKVYEMEEAYKIGTVVTGFVTGIKEYGIFVHLDEYHSGLIHISEISTHFVSNIHNYVAMGEIIRVKIIGQEDSKHYQLSIKEIDYRIMKRHDSKIKETNSGFKNLATNLDNWIKLKLNTYCEENGK